MDTLGKVHEDSTNYRDFISRAIRDMDDAQKVQLYSSFAKIIGAKEWTGSYSVQLDIRIGAIAYEAYRCEPKQTMKVLKPIPEERVKKLIGSLKARR